MATKEGIVLLPYNERVKLVRSRLSSLRYPKIEPLKKPAKVVAAQKIVDEWAEKETAHEDAQRLAHKQKLHAIEDALIVGDMLKAVELMSKLGETK